MAKNSEAKQATELLQKIARASEEEARAYIELQKLFPDAAILDLYNPVAVELLKVYQRVTQAVNVRINRS